MKVMTLHIWHDSDVEQVLWESFRDDVREIDFTWSKDESFQISKADVIALAKEFNLVVFEKDAAL